MNGTLLPGRNVSAFLLLVSALLAGCGSDAGRDASPAQEAEDVHEETEEGHAGDAVRLDAHVLEEFGIELGTAGPGSIRQQLHLPGEILPDEDRLAHIVPRFEGIVTDVRARIGDKVEAGDVLASIESSESLAPYELKTFIEGTILARHVTQGEAVGREHEAFVVADLRMVWVDLSVYQRDLSSVKVGQPARIVSAESDLSADGLISYVTPAVDEATRTATARVVLQNPDGAWRPGMFVIGQVTVEDTEVRLAVPRSALETVEGKTVVFVETPEGFVARPVALGREGEADVEILSGLVPGERYVTRGGFTLKAELGKGSFEAGHAH